MKLQHSAIDSPFFELVKTIEVDLALRDDLVVPLRIELFEDSENAGRFRCHLWEREMFRMTPSFPQDHRGRPNEISDDELLAERSTQLTGDYQDFTAPAAEAALAKVLDDLAARLEHWTGRKAGSPRHTA